MNLSARAPDRLLRVARTIADLDGADQLPRSIAGFEIRPFAVAAASPRTTSLVFVRALALSSSALFQSKDLLGRPIGFRLALATAIPVLIPSE
jgi:hypothetical protein